MKKTAILLLGALVMGQAMAANQVIKVASLTPLSGGQSNLGEQIKLGAQLAVTEAKARFDKLGFDLQFAPYDDQATPDVGTAAARKIASDKNVLALVGTLNSGVAIPVSSVLKDEHLAMVSPANTANAVTDRGLANMNRIVARDDSQGPAAGDYIVNTLKAKKVYVLNDKTAYGQGLASEVEKYVRAKGLQVVGSEGTEEKSNFQPVVIKIKALQPDVIYFGGIYDQGAVLLKQLRQAGVTAKFMGGDGLDSSEFQKIAGPAAKGALFTTVAGPASVFPKAGIFARNFKKAFGKDAQGFAVFGYDAANVTLAGIENAIKANGNKLPSRTQVEKAIRGVKVSSLLSGTVQFNSVGDRVTGSLFVVQIQDNLSGKVVKTLTVKAPKK